MNQIWQYLETIPLVFRGVWWLTVYHIFYLNTKNVTDGKKHKNETMFTFEILYLFYIPLW